jgi:hypothetical protein
MSEEKGANKATIWTYLTHGCYGAAVRGGTTFAYANFWDAQRTVSQTQNISSKAVWSQSIKTHGGFWRGTVALHWSGMAPNLLRVSSREAVRAVTMSYIDTMNLSGLLKTGLMTGIDMLASIPDTIKVRQQANIADRKRWVYPLHVYTSGFVPTGVRQLGRWGGVYVFKPQIYSFFESTQDTHQLPKFQMNLLANITTASIASFFVLPFDAVKSRMQNGQATGNIVKTAADMVREHGVKSLVRGGLPKWFITVNAVMNTLIVQDWISAESQRPKPAKEVDKSYWMRFFEGNATETKATTETSESNKKTPGCTK